MQGAGAGLLQFMLITLMTVGCASQPTIVSDPPEHPRLPNEPVPWEEQYARAMMKPGVLPDVKPDPHENQKFNGRLEEQDSRGGLGVFADVIAFPFRAIGWLLESLF